jgi:uncharacterized protein YjdB
MSSPLHVSIRGSIWRVRYRTALIILVSALIAGCGGGSDHTSNPTTPGVRLSQIDVEPSNRSIANGTSMEFTATGIYSDGTNQDLTTQVTWSSSDAGIATISNTVGTVGIATSVAAGTTTITAAMSGVSASATLTVTSAVLVAIDVTPSTLSLANGTSTSVTATGRFSDGSTQDMTDQVSWQSSSSSIATVSSSVPNNGLVAAMGVGSATITATLGSVSGTVSISVTSATLMSIEVEPALPSLAKGTRVQMSAVGRFSDGSLQDITQAATWNSSSSAVATVGNSGSDNGIVTSVAMGTVTITASLSGIDGGTTLTVTAAALTGIDITASDADIPNGTKLQLSAVGTFTDQSTQDITDQVTWTSSQTSIATVSNASGSRGLVSGHSVGSTTIGATLSGVNASFPVDVTNASLVSINITPPSFSLAAGLSIALKATGNYSDGSTLDLTDQVSWFSSDASIVQVSNASGSRGMADAVAPGIANISASFSGLSGTSYLTVTNATLMSIDVSPATPSVAAGLTLSFNATGHFSDSSTLDITQLVLWQSSDNGVATISNFDSTRGTITAVSQGTTTISATLGSITGTTPLSVTNAQLTSIQVTPANPAAVVGGTVQMTAIGAFTDTSQQDITSQVTWASSDTTVAGVSNAASSKGLVTGNGVGQSTITATFGAIQGSATATISSDPNSPVSLTAVAAPDLILNDGADASTITVTVKPADSGGVIADGTVIDFQITQGTGTLSAASAMTSGGMATVSLTSMDTGVVTVTATVHNTAISNFAAVYATPHLYDALSKSIVLSVMTQGNVVKAGSIFGFYITNHSNRQFDIDQYQFMDGATVLGTITSTSALNGGHLLAGETTGILFQLSQDRTDSGFSATYSLTDPVTATSFNLSVTYVLP